LGRASKNRKLEEALKSVGSGQWEPKSGEYQVYSKTEWCRGLIAAISFEHLSIIKKPIIAAINSRHPQAEASF
jgi:hypothetical protein